MDDYRAIALNKDGRLFFYPINKYKDFSECYDMFAVSENLADSNEFSLIKYGNCFFCYSNDGELEVYLPFELNEDQCKVFNNIYKYLNNVKNICIYYGNINNCYCYDIDCVENLKAFIDECYFKRRKKAI